MIELAFTGVKATSGRMDRVARITPGRAAGAMNAAVTHARKETIRRLAAITGVPRRLLAGTGSLGKGGHIKRLKARARRPIARLVGLVAGIRLIRVGVRRAGNSPMNMPASVIPRLFTATVGRHLGVFARYPVPSRRKSTRASPGTRRANLPINEAVIQIYTPGRKIMAETMDFASRVIYPRELWARLEKAVRAKARR